MSDISNQLIKDSFNYVLQSDLTTGVVYRIGGSVPINPIFQSGLTIQTSLRYSDGSEGNGLVLTSDASGNASWKPISGATPSSGVTSISVGNGLSANTSTGNVFIEFTGSTNVSGAYLPLSGGTVSGTSYFTDGLSANTFSAETIQLYTSYTGLTNVGQLTWNQDFGTLQQGLIGGNVVQKIGESVYAYVHNAELTTLTRGEVVYIYGSNGDKMSVKRAVNTGDTTSSKTLGVVAESIPAGGLGFVLTQGTLEKLNLGSYNAGDIVWLSSTPGQFTKTKQYAPYHLVFVGVVQRANNGNGQLYVKPQNGYELEELHNVVATGSSYGDLIVYSASNGNNLWVHSKVLTGDYTINGGITITGKTVLDGTSASTLNVTGFTILDGTTANTISATTIITPGVTLNNGIISNTISATTYQNLPIDIRVTGGTYSNGTATFTNNTGGTFNVSGFKTNDIFVTGGTKSGSNVTFTNNTGGTFTITGFSDTFVTGSTYTPSTGSFLFRNNTGGTFSVGGLNYVTGGTYDSGSQTLSLTTNTGSTISIGGFPTQVGPAGTNYEIQYNASNSFGSTSNLIYNYNGEVFNSSRNYVIDTDITYSSIVGGSDHSLLTASFRVGIFAGSTNKIETNSYDSTIIGGNTNTIRSGSYNCSIIGGGTNLIDASVESVIIGGSNNTINSGTRMILLGTQSITPTTNDTVYVPYLSLTSGLSNDDTNNDILVRNPSTGIIDYRSAGSLPNTYVTGATYSNNTFTYTDNSNNSFSVLFNTLTGLTINGNLTTTGTTTSRIISATTYQNLPTDVRVTGSTYSNNTFTFTNNTGGTFNVLFNTLTGLTINGNLSVTGTTSSTSFSGGSLTLSNSASTISLNNTSRQQIRFFSAGTGAPTYNTYSAGAKIIFSDNISSISSGYAIGVDAGSLWYGSDLAGNGHDWYAGTRKLASLIGSAGFQLIGLGGPTTTAMVISGTAAAGSKGGAGYIDFLQVINNWSGATNPNKWFRVNSTGGLELLNSVYTATTLTLSDNGILSVGGGNTATSSSNDGTNNYLSFNGNNSQIYDDGNMHIHSRSAGQSMWINTNGGTIIMGNQAPVGGGSVAVGVAIGSGTSLNGYVTIHSTKSFSTSAAYGYLTTAGAGTFGGGAQTLPISLYAAGRIWGAEIDAFSDERMKDIQGEITLEEGLKLVNNLKPIKYTWKESEDKGIKAGYSAQQVVKAGFNHLIGVIPKEGLEETIDDDGFVSPKDTQFSMNYDQVTPYHGVVIKHLLDKIEELESIVKDLQSKIK